MRFSLAPFPCPECGHELAVVGVRQGVEPEEWTVGEVFDQTTWDADRGHWPAWVASYGRDRLCSEVIRLSKKVYDLERDEATRKNRWKLW